MPVLCGFRYSVYYSKKLFWQFEVEGLQDEKKERERETLNDIAEFAQDSFDVDNAVKNVRVFWDDFIRFTGMNSKHVLMIVYSCVFN